MTVGGPGGVGGSSGGGGAPRKKQRVGSSNNSRLPSTLAIVIDSSRPEESLTEVTPKPLGAGLRRSSSRSFLQTSYTSSSSSPATAAGFDDSSLADVILRLYIEKPSLFVSDGSDSSSAVKQQPDVQIYLHSDVLRRCKYFDALLSDRWWKDSNDVVRFQILHHLNLSISPSYS